jgi:flagellar hook-associated protein 1 FlgK
VSVQDLGGGAIKLSFGDAAQPVIDKDPVTSAPVANWPQAITSAAGGKLGQLLKLSDAGGTIDTMKSQLDAVALELKDAVNFLHNPTGTGADFFTGTGAADLAVSATAGTLVASFSPDKGANDVALQIAALRYAPSTRPAAPTLTATQMYGQLVSNVGGQAQNAERQQKNAEALSNSMEDRRQSMAGVSMDEEMSNLIRFQRAYQASARSMSAMDELLDNLINRTGKVGL